MDTNDIDTAALKKLRAPFPPEQIGKLPKGGMFLDFVGHGFLTARFLDADPAWTWEPLAFDENGLPRLDDNGGLWIRLTIGGVTRIGYGDAGGKHGANAIKEAIGDALRNAGMRFGAALDLWCKGDPDAAPAPSDASVARSELAAVCKKARLRTSEIGKRFLDAHGIAISAADADTIRAFTKLVEQEIAVDEAAEAVPGE